MPLGKFGPGSPGPKAFLRARLASSSVIWKPDTLDETPRKCSYKYILSMYLYMSVRKHRNSMYLVHTSTGFLYLYVPSMYISKFICDGMYQYVLVGDKTVFCGMMKSPSDQMLQESPSDQMLQDSSPVSKYTVLASGFLHLVCTGYVLSTY